MLSKISKYVPVLSLWLAAVILCAHQIIPHDHHFAASYEDQEKNCPVSGHKSDHHTGFPVHCHAFNDLVSEKTRSFNVPRNFHFTFIAIISNTNTAAYPTTIEGETTFSLPESHIDSAILELSFLRAPPVLA